MQRYFVNIKNDNMFKIVDNDYHHIVNVMRMKPGYFLEVSYENILYLCKIDEIDKSTITVSIVKEIDENPELNVDIIIAQALVKEDKMDYILQKGTELGVKGFIPVLMNRSIIKIDENKLGKKLSRWQKICKEASEQSKRITIPSVNHPVTINELIKMDFNYKILCSVNEKENSIKRVLQQLQNNDKIIVVIGPEGGMTEAEEQLLIGNGFISVSLGNRVLRTETASMFIASIINYELMR